MTDSGNPTVESTTEYPEAIPSIKSTELNDTTDGPVESEVEPNVQQPMETTPNGMNGQDENAASDTKTESQNGQPQIETATTAESGVSVDDFEFKHSDNGYYYYTDRDGRWYAVDEAGSWYYQDADGSFKPWDNQSSASNSEQTKTEDTQAMDVEIIQKPIKPADAIPEPITKLEQQGLGTTVAKPDEGKDLAFIVEISPDGRPQYPRRSDGKPILPIGKDGKKIFPLGPDGYPLFPVDENGRPTFPYGDDDQPAFPIGPHNKPMVPVDEKGEPIFPMGKDGLPIFPVGQDGKPCAPMTADGRTVLPRDREGKPIVPYGPDGQPLIVLGPDGTPLQNTSTASQQPPVPPSTQQAADWNAYYQQYYQYYGYQYPYAPYQYPPYGVSTYGSSYGNFPFGGHSYAGFTNQPSSTSTVKRRVRPEDIDLPPGPPPTQDLLVAAKFGDQSFKGGVFQGQAGAGDDKQQSATKQLAARQIRALSLINQFKKESEKGLEVGKKLATQQQLQQQQPPTQTHRNLFDITDTMKLEQQAASGMQKVSTDNVSGTEVQKDENVRAPGRQLFRPSPMRKIVSPVSPSRRRSRRSDSRSPRRRSTSASPDRYDRKDRDGKYGKVGREYRGRHRRGDSRDRFRDRSRGDRRDRHRRRSESGSRSERSTDRSPPKQGTKENIASSTDDQIWNPDLQGTKKLAVRSQKEDGGEILWERDMLAKTRSTPALWYSCNPQQWISFEKLLLEKEKGPEKSTKDADQEKADQPVHEEENLDSQMYGPKIAPPAILAEGKWKPMAAPEEKPKPEERENKPLIEKPPNQPVSSTKDDLVLKSKQLRAMEKRKKQKKDKKRLVDPELERLRHEALATIEKAKKDYEYYETLAKQQSPSSGEESNHEDDTSNADLKTSHKIMADKKTKKKKKAKSSSDEDEEKSTQSSPEEKKKKRRRSGRKEEKLKRKRKHHRNKRYSSSDEEDDIKEKTDEESSAVSSASEESDSAYDERKKRKSRKKKRSEKKSRSKLTGKKQKKKKRHRTKPSTDEDDETDEEKSASDVADDSNDSDSVDEEQPRKRKHTSSNSDSEEKSTARKTKRGKEKKRKLRDASSNSESFEEEQESINSKKRAKKSSEHQSSEEGKETKNKPVIAQQGGNTTQVKRGFFMGSLDTTTGPSTLPDIPLPRECYANTGSKSTTQKNSPPPPPPKDKKTRTSHGEHDSPPPPPPPKKPADLAKQFGSPTPKVGHQTIGSGTSSQPIFIPVATYRAFAPQPNAVPSATSMKQNYPYGTNR